jgi:hypothetical protein
MKFFLIILIKNIRKTKRVCKKKLIETAFAFFILEKQISNLVKWNTYFLNF